MTNTTILLIILSLMISASAKTEGFKATVINLLIAIVFAVVLEAVIWT